MKQKVKEAVAHVRALAAREALRVGTLPKIALIFNVVIFPVFVAVLTANYAEFTAGTKWIFWLLVAVITVVAIVMAIIQLVGTGSAVEAYFEAQKTFDHAEELEEDRDRYELQIDASAAAMSINLAWLNSIPGYVRRDNFGIEDIKEASEEMIGLLIDERRTLFGMTDAVEHWNFAVYLFDRERRLLDPVFRRKHEDHPGSPRGRTFAPGQGHVGKAFADRVAKVTADADNHDVRILMDAAQELTKPYDRTAYRSYSSVPIGSGQVDGFPYGVVVGTSSFPGRFTFENSYVLRNAAAVLANLVELTQYDHRAIVTDSVET